MQRVYLAYRGKGATKYRAYKFHAGDGGVIDAQVEDNVTPFLNAMARSMPRELHKGLSSLGWHLSKQLKQVVKNGGPRGENWPDVSGIVRGKDGSLRRARRTQRQRFYGALGNTLGYYRHPLPALRVSIGWLSLAASQRGEKLQRGYTLTPTQKQRRLFAASARWTKKHDRVRSGSVYPLAAESIKVPGRNLIAPVYAQEQRNIRPLLESKLKVYMRKQEAFFASTTSNAAKRAAQRG
ncbi:hypothetical protein N1030_01725 [Desulfovibrio mangrovi]|uniref:hypothetical protein n=1 Tax=Desulfovibrio mangrovi TaxID=2976983 RepID=UPI0022458CF6|nr:hypothetical protein [Desulfovibrio mangrovi]UZP67714.1 hypothetical protein N1030_01725 [Desulfovibrio mangrovi]